VGCKTLTQSVIQFPLLFILVLVVVNEFVIFSFLAIFIFTNNNYTGLFFIVNESLTDIFAYCKLYSVFDIQKLCAL